MSTVWRLYKYVHGKIKVAGGEITESKVNKKEGNICISGYPGGTDAGVAIMLEERIVWYIRERERACHGHDGDIDGVCVV